MDYLITLIRFPFGVVWILIVTGFWCGLFLGELFIFLICIIPATVFMNRNNFRESWPGTFPYTIKSWGVSVNDIKDWISNK